MSQPPTFFPNGVQNKNANDTENRGTSTSTAPSATGKPPTQSGAFSRPADEQTSRFGAGLTQTPQPTSAFKPSGFAPRPTDPAASPARPAFGTTAGSSPFSSAGTTPTQPSAFGGATSPYVGQSGLVQPNLGQSTWTSPLRQAAQTPPGTSVSSPFAAKDAAAQRSPVGAQQASAFGTTGSSLFPSAGAAGNRTSAFQSGANATPQATMPPKTPLFRSTQPGTPLRQPLTPSSAFRTPTPAVENTKATSPFRKDLQISDEEFLQLRDFIYQQCGIFIAENRKYLVENRLSNRIKDLNLKSYNEYYNFLRFDASRKTELNKLFEVVTTNETSFFRNPPQLEVFQKNVLPDILDQCRQKGQKKLRIWSAGCSTGEEPYTLAIILHEVLRSEIHSWDIKITANDLSEAVLAAARRGIYSEYALRTTPKSIVDTYFVKEDSVYKIKPELKDLVSFGQINLSDKEQLRRVDKSQIVFCRNVIIYFDDEMKRKVINAFYDNLEVNGALLIGHSESLHNISRAFQLEHFKGTIVYRKLA